jgi:hypothetical protein
VTTEKLRTLDLPTSPQWSDGMRQWLMAFR